MHRPDPGDVGEVSVRSELKKLKGSLICGFIRSRNICYYGQNFQIDFLVFAPKVGLVLLEVKNWRGTVKTTSHDTWVREYNNAKDEHRNASLQALRTAGLLLRILEKGKINKWPIRPVVVFANDNAFILRSKSQPPQTDIILKTMIESWLANNGIDEVLYKFTTAEFEKVKNVICEYTTDYIENA